MNNEYIEDIRSYFKGGFCLNEDGTYLAMTTESVQGVAIEKGLGYKVTVYNDALASSATDAYLLKTPPTGLVTFGLNSITCADTANVKSAVVEMNFYEGGTVTANGGDTNVLVRNYNRAFGDANGFIVKSSPTITADGIYVSKTLVSSNVIAYPNITFQLDANTNYILKIKNVSDVTARYVANFTVFDLG